MLSKSVSYFCRTASRVVAQAVLGSLAPGYKLAHYVEGLVFEDEYSLKRLKAFIRQERVPGLTKTHVLIGLSDNREVWLDSGRNFVVSGQAGCGKSILESFLTFQRVSMGQSVLVLDWVGDTSSRERIQRGLKMAGLKPLKELQISGVGEFDGIWQGNGLLDLKFAQDEMRLVLERLIQKLSNRETAFDSPQLVIISEADWLIQNPESPEAALILKLLTQVRSLNVAIGLFVQKPAEIVLSKCATSIDFRAENSTGLCDVRACSRLRDGVSFENWFITARVPFFNPKPPINKNQTND